MLIDLADKTAIVTGSTAGIGLAIAHGLAHAGASVVVNGRTEERVHSAVAQLRSAYPDAFAQRPPKQTTSGAAVQNSEHCAADDADEGALTNG